MANTGVGLLTSLGSADEVTYGTVVTPDRWFEITSEGLERKNTIIQSNALKPGAIHSRRSSRRVVAAQWGEGPVTMEVPTKGFGRLLKHAIGGTPTIVQEGATTAWRQTHSYGSNVGMSQTLQKVIRDGSNTVVQQFTHAGAKVKSVEFSISVDQFLTATFDFDSRQENTDTAVAPPTYSASKPFHFGQISTLTLAGGPVVKVRDATLKIERPQKTDSFYLGSSGLKSAPTENDFPMITGSLTAEFDTDNKVALYDAFAADTAVALVLTFEGATIASTFKEKISFSVPAIHLTGETPKVGGPEEVTLTTPFEGAWDDSTSDITVTYTSTDTAV